MEKQKTLARIEELGLVAVLRGPTPELTVQMVDALVAGGVTGIEITFTTPQATEVVRTLSNKYGNAITLGMGTLIQPDQARQAIDAGARYLVSPHCEESLARTMVATGVPVMIGALTPSEIVLANKLGADVVKIFPGSLGGPDYLKALRGPFPHIKMMPTGGVSKTNAGDWFAAGACAVGAGSELCPPAWAKEGRFADITRNAGEFALVVKKARMK